MRWHPTVQNVPNMHSLYVHAGEVARVHLQDGRWIATLRLNGQDKTRECSSLEAGMAGCEAWARKHLDHFAAEHDRIMGEGVFRAFRRKPVAS